MSFLQITLLIIVLSLTAVAIFVSLQSTTPTLHLLSLKNYLIALRSKLVSPELVSADKERAEIEVLLNKVKTSSSLQNISDDKELKSLLNETCERIKIIVGSSESDQKTAWHKFKNVTFDFNEFYYPLPNVVVDTNIRS